ncbi:hypothetical protein AB3S75_039968 [Citrus x aurantiifolia]
MAKESTQSSVATSPLTTTNWWDLHNHHHHHASSISSWTNASCSPWHQQQNPNSNSSCEEEVSNISTSFTYASNQSGLSVASSHRLDEPATVGGATSNELIGEHAPDNHQLWSHVFLSDGNNGDLHNSHQEIGENLLLNTLSSKAISSSTGMIFDPAYDYLKKMDSSNWEFTTNSSSFNNNNFEKHLNGITTTSGETERLNRLSNLVSHWSIAPPDPQIGPHFINPESTCDNIRNSGLLSYYGHNDFKMENEFLKPFTSSNGFGYNNVGFNGSTCSLVEADDGDNKYYYGARNFADAITLSSRLSKPLIDIHIPNKPYFKSSLNLLSECKKKQGHRTSSPMRICGKERGISNEGKKKRYEENSEAVVKKSKTESSTASSAKAPKVKLADKITALQQIVSPFGKTDTASVLYEAIGYIKFLQEQVQLLSNPYMKSILHKDPWGSLDRKEKGDVKVDLRSRGLCVVPISCTPKAYHDNNGSDYWTPAYRGCLYR